MSKTRYKTANWKQYNEALINHGSLIFWIDEEAIATGGIAVNIMVIGAEDTLTVTCLSRLH